MGDDLTPQSIELAVEPLRLLQPAESAEFPDEGGVEWAPLVPYWSVLWRSGVALARELDGADLAGKRVIELGCGLGAPSLVAARRGARVLATDLSEEALELLVRNADLNVVSVATEVRSWDGPNAAAGAPFDVVLAADVLYEEEAIGPLLSLLPRLAQEVRLADPGRSPAETFLERASERWSVTTAQRGVVAIHHLEAR